MELDSAQADYAIPRAEVDHFCSLLIDGLQVRSDLAPTPAQSPSSPVCVLLGPSTNPSAEAAAFEVCWVESCRHVWLREAYQAFWTRRGGFHRLRDGLYSPAGTETDRAGAQRRHLLVLGSLATAPASAATVSARGCF